MQLDSPTTRSGRLLAVAAILIAAAAILMSAFPALAQSPSPVPSGSPSPQPSAQPSAQASGQITIEAHPLLGGHVRPGAWAAVSVQITNNGPAIDGELLIRGPQQNQSRYGVEAHLPPDAKQAFTLYAQTAVFGSKVNVDLVSGDQTLATQQVKITSHDAYTPIVAVVAERPEQIVPAVKDGMVNPNAQPGTVITLGPGELPPRVEAWAAVDQLIWQDVDASLLSDEQLGALKLWLGAGGRLTILGGTKGGDPMRGFTQELLPYNPTKTVDVDPSELTTLLGGLPSGAAVVPAVAGALDHGTILARGGDDVVAAQASYGRGAVSIIGFDPATSWIAESTASDALWHRLLPQSSNPVLNPLAITDDSQIIYALQNLPAVDLPPIEQLFALLLGYIVLIGPINYLILRKLDKREWAWVTIPALVAVFAVGSYALGATLKGSDVIVNEITVVRAAQGTGRGIGQAYIGIYSPNRRTFDVRIPGGALLSNPASQAMVSGTETPLDVIFGDSTSQLRNFEVGFGVLRGFRAEAPADAPQVDADLTVREGKLQGTVTNRSDTTLENVAVLYSGSAAVLPSIGPGETKDIDLDLANNPFFGYGLSELIFGSSFPRDAAQARDVSTRRAVIDQLFPWGSQGSNDTPLLLAWRRGPVLDVDLDGDQPNRVGQGLFMIPLAAKLAPQQVFADAVMRRTVVETTAANAWGDSSGLYLSRGTMTVEARPSFFDGTFETTSLEIAMTQGDQRTLRGNGSVLQPLPPDQQPAQDDPLGENPGASPDPNASPDPSASPGSDEPPPPVEPPCCKGGIGLGETMPDFQLFDHTTQQWVEFPHPDTTSTYLIADPQRYVDPSGAVLFRFVNRSEPGQFGEDQKYFQLLIRLEGTIS